MSGKMPQERLKIEVIEEEIAEADILRKKPLIPSRPPTALFEGSRETLEKTESSSSVIGGTEKWSDPAGSTKLVK